MINLLYYMLILLIEYSIYFRDYENNDEKITLIQQLLSEVTTYIYLMYIIIHLLNAIYFTSDFIYHCI